MTAETDEQIIMKHDRACRQRARMEVMIVNAVLDEAVKQGFAMKVADYDEDDGPKVTPDKELIKSRIFNLDDADLHLFKQNRSMGWIRFVFGNDGYDAISDYSTRLEEFLKPVNELSDKLANGLA